MLNDSPFDNQARDHEDTRKDNQRQACDRDLVTNRVGIHVIGHDTRRRKQGGLRGLPWLQMKSAGGIVLSRREKYRSHREFNNNNNARSINHGRTALDRGGRISSCI